MEMAVRNVGVKTSEVRLLFISRSHKRNISFGTVQTVRRAFQICAIAATRAIHFLRCREQTTLPEHSGSIHLFTHFSFSLFLLITKVIKCTYLQGISCRFSRRNYYSWTFFVSLLYYEHWLQQVHTTSSQSALRSSIGQPLSNSITPVKLLYSKASFSAERQTILQVSELETG